ncbi:MAG TPA: ester cyclase [Actinomycetota bacterium]|nr:ester cyclase [Actinomycetota bacterium]
MSEAVELARKIVDLTDSGNFRAREHLIHPDCEIVMSGAGRLTRQEFTRYSQALATAFPQAEHVFEQTLEFAGTVVIEGMWIATQTGPFETPQGRIPATGRTMRTRLCLVFYILDGLAVSIHGYWDQLEMLQQLGLVPEPAAL